MSVKISIALNFFFCSEAFVGWRRHGCGCGMSWRVRAGARYWAGARYLILCGLVLFPFIFVNLIEKAPSHSFKCLFPSEKLNEQVNVHWTFLLRLHLRIVYSRIPFSSSFHTLTLSKISQNKKNLCGIFFFL